MKKQLLLQEHIDCIDIHAKRIIESLQVISKVTPITFASIQRMPLLESSCLEVIYSRMGKIQDTLGTKLFPTLLDIVDGTITGTYIDRLNRLEKFGYIESAEWWNDFRELRNEITHDYGKNYEAIAEQANEVIFRAHELLLYWEQLKVKIEPLTK